MWILGLCKEVKSSLCLGHVSEAYYAGHLMAKLLVRNDVKLPPLSITRFTSSSGSPDELDRA